MNEELQDLVHEYLYNTVAATYEDEPFLIIDEWVEIETFMLGVLKAACSEETIEKYYKSRNAIHKRYGEEGLKYGDLRVGQPKKYHEGEPNGTITEDGPFLIPNEVRDSLLEAGFIDEDIENPDFEDIIDSAWGFSDEYRKCDFCHTAVRISPDSYHWTKDHEYFGTGELICGDCIRAEVDLQKDYIENILNNPEKANTILEEEHFEKLGYTKLSNLSYYEKEEFDAGLHGYHDDPSEQLKELSNDFEKVVFDITSTGQFQTYWQVWVKNAISEEYAA